MYARKYQYHIPDPLELENKQQNVVPNDASSPIGVATKEKLFQMFFQNEKADKSIIVYLIWSMKFQNQ